MVAKALVLNASFEPLQVVSWQKAIQLLFQGKVEVLEEHEKEVRSVRVTIRIPAVLRLLSYIPVNQKRQIIRFSRTNVFLRDDYKCQYCGKQAPKSNLTLDHVVPVVKGGKRHWNNIVTCCRKCNQKKGGRTPDESGMKLKTQPVQPTWLPQAAYQIRVGVNIESWRPYLEVTVAQQKRRKKDS